MSDSVWPQPVIRPAGQLVNRIDERAAIDDLLDGVREGLSESLVVLGPPGIGKSTLLEHALRGATGMSACRIEGIESEMSLSFAGIVQVVTPLLRHSGELPHRHRRALEWALGLSTPDEDEDEDVDVFAVGMAVLGLLSGAASAGPLLLVVDDAQWLDEESANVLAFVARRLHADPVGMLFALWDAGESPIARAGLPQLDITGLSKPDARELLASTSGGAVSADVKARVVSAAQGNPLAVVELVGALSADQLSGASPLPDPLPLGRQVDEIFATRAARLDADTRTVLLLAAAEPSGEPGLVITAARTLGLQACEEVMASAEGTGLVTFSPRIEFRHPLARSCVYYSAPAAQRRRIHRTLAGALTNPADSDRRAWHLGVAYVEPDEGVARELEAAADRARKRGGTSIAVAHLLRAAELTPEPDRANQRLMEAARAEITAGNPGRAEAIVERVRLAAPTAPQQAELAWTEALVRIATGRVAEAGSLIAHVLPVVETGGRDTALGALVTAAAVLLDAGHLAPGPERTRIVQAVREAISEQDLPHAVADLLGGVVARLTEGYGSAAPSWRRAVLAATDGSPRLLEEVGRHVHVFFLDAVLAAVDLLDDAALSELTHSWVELARQSGALAALPLALNMSCWLEILEGRVRTAGSHLAEIEDIVALTGQRGLLGTPTPAMVLRQAWQGDERRARAAARRMMQDAHERGEGRGIDQAHQALLVLEVGSGQYEAALRIARRQAARDGMGAGTLALAEVVEAATRCGQEHLGLEALDQLERRAAASGSGWAEGLLARARALLARDDEADSHFQAATEHLAGSRIATERARTQLLHGEWLRRSRRRLDARGPLYEALEFFDAMGATRFAARTRQELAATGERVRSGDAPADLLTPQEAQIARRAAAGDRNQEIAAQLFITTSTVEYHLRKVFVKLGVRSRTELASLDLPA